MQRKIKVAAGLLLIMALMLPAYGQDVELRIPHDTLASCSTSTFMVPVTVRNFQGISGVQLYIRYDTSVLAYSTLTSDTLNGATINASEGLISMIWEDFANPITLADNDTLLFITFTRPTGGYFFSHLLFTGNNEVVNEVGDPLPLTPYSGSITCRDIDKLQIIIPDVLACDEGEATAVITVREFSNIAGVQI